MNSKEHLEYQLAFEKFAEKLISSKKEAASFLKKSGIHNNKGNLHEAYR